ncbi:MAG: protein kinase domain-containing protein [Promethearchaeota archaeon]
MEFIDKIADKKAEIQKIIFKIAYNNLFEGISDNHFILEDLVSEPEVDIVREVFYELKNNGMISDYNLVLGPSHCQDFIFWANDKGLIAYEKQLESHSLINEYIRFLMIVASREDMISDILPKMKKAKTELSDAAMKPFLSSISAICENKYGGGAFMLVDGRKSITKIGIELLNDYESALPLIQRDKFISQVASVLDSHFIRIIETDYKEGHKGWVIKGIDGRDLIIAIKIYKEAYTDANKAELLRESNILSRLSHSNIVKYKFHFIFTFQNQQYMILVEEYINGKTLEESYVFLREFSLEKKIALILEFIDALEYLNAQLEFHGDLSSRNIMISSEKSTLLIIDPGFSGCQITDPQKLISAEKQFLLNICKKIFTFLEITKINLDAIMEIDSFNEFRVFFSKFISDTEVMGE